MMQHNEYFLLKLLFLSNKMSISYTGQYLYTQISARIEQQTASVVAKLGAAYYL